MILKRKIFAKKSNEIDNAITGASIVGGGYGLAKTKSGRLTGKVTRYHDAPTDVIEKIKKEGLKASYSTDPGNLTNQVLEDVPMEAKKGLVYTAKKRSIAHGVGIRRAQVNGDITDIGVAKETLTGRSPHHKTLKMEFDYDELKKAAPKKRIVNPELRGATDAKGFYNKRRGILSPAWENLDPLQKAVEKEGFNQLNDGTHIFKGDVGSKHIVGGQGYKKRTARQVGKYIKKNPGRFGKEAAKVVVSTAALGYGAKKLYDSKKKKEEK